jgi:hypothetical protein
MPYYDNDLSDDISTNTYTSRVKNAKKLLAELNEDKGFRQIKRRDPNTSKWVTRNLYVSGDTGSSIRDAVTGIRNFNHKVGSFSEDLYFKVGISTGELGPNTNTLFFDSPEIYERYMFNSIPNEIKEAWRMKNLEARRRLNLVELSPNSLELSNGQRAFQVK